MPNFVKTALLYLTGYARIIILIGIGLIVFSLWSQWKASDDNAYVQRDRLQTVSGFVKTASEITVKRKRGSPQRYYQIELTPGDGGEAMELRISFSVPRGSVSNLIEENVTALFDSSDNNLIYEAAIDGNDAPEITYEATRDRLLAAAKDTADSFSGTIFWFISIALIAAGGTGIALQRKLQAEPASEPQPDKS
ncbi:MAG: hypothetical protein LBL48_00475 [Azoarcus sp.]|jgi:hypothetical protein|nr:hypothetical protein [Azoarcus sp.]